jgi:hypothetical protein
MRQIDKYLVKFILFKLSKILTYILTIETLRKYSEFLVSKPSNFSEPRSNLHEAFQLLIYARLVKDL